MSRSGPPGRTAAERTTTLDTGTSQNPAEHRTGAPSDGLLDAEAEAWIEARWRECMDAGRPISRRRLRQQLVREWEREDRAAAVAKAGPVVLTFVRRGGEVSRSVPVDAAVGELVARIG